MGKHVAIIGAGLAGMSAGIHLARKGIEVDLYELAPWAGGMCTSWQRGGYWFDGCISWMVGLKKGDGFRRLYREVEALAEDTPAYFCETLTKQIGGAVYRIPMQPEPFRAYLKGLAPEDAAAIDGLCNDIKRVAEGVMPVNITTASEFFSSFKSFGGMMAMGKYMSLTIGEYVQRFSSPVIRALIESLMPPEFVAGGLIMMMGTRMGRNAGYPLGGARDVMRRMEAAFQVAGGRLHLNSPVEEILVENGRAAGVRVKGEEHRADAVIAACDMHTVLTKLLGGRYPHPQLDEMLREAKLFDPLALVSFGVKKRFGISYEEHWECEIKTSPDTAANSFLLRSFDFDPSAAPEGKSSVMAMLDAPLAYWRTLRETDKEAYHREKRRLADAVAAEIEKRYPGFTQEIEITDVSTPATYERLTNAYKASFEGFAPVPGMMTKKIQKSVPGIQNLVLCGQWTMAGGGICTCVQDGKAAANAAARLK
ncbi:MAG TPA: NAD(P)/FAD-dependent oxidoreductase [Feifaniaceae bacterium]|nr:NAD(P)/FAD-dependent oxidoreductase [Feifaniaceae bacterium]